MDVETPNVSAMTNDERTPLIDRAPRARVTKPAAWVWAIVMVTCLAGVIFLGVSGNLHQNMGVSGNDNDMGVSGNNQDAAAVHAAGDSSHLGVPLPTINCPTSSVNFAMSLHQVYGNSINVQLPRVEACTPKFAGQRKCVGVGGNTVSTALPNPNVNIQIETPQIDGYSFCSVKTLIDELKSSSVTPTKVKTAACQLVGASSDVCRVLTDVINHAANLADQIADLKNMHTLSDLQNNAIIPPDIKNAVSTVVDSIDGVKRDVVSLIKDIGTTTQLVTDAVVGYTSLIDAISKAPDKLFTALLDKVIPTNAYNLVTMLKVPALNTASAGGAAALGASAPAIIHPDNTQALRLLIREALGVETENVTEVYGLESVSEHHARLATEMEAALGGDKDEGSCFPLDIPIFDEFMSATDYEMLWPEKLFDDGHAPDAFEIRLPKFTVSTCIKAEFQLPLHACDVLVMGRNRWGSVLVYSYLPYPYAPKEK